MQLARACSPVLLALSLAPATLAQSIEKLSVSPTGAPGNAAATPPLYVQDILTPDGRFVVLYGDASNLVPGDTNGWQDVFVRDTLNGTTRRASFGTGGVQPNLDCVSGAVSDDGNRVAFSSGASNLIPGIAPTAFDVFVTDGAAGTVQLASVSILGGAGNGFSEDPSISGNGRWVAFSSDADDLVPGDTNGRPDVFVRDLVAGTTVRVSTSSAGAQGNGDSKDCAISGDGRYVVFASSASNLHPLGNGAFQQIYVKDLATGNLELVSVSSAGVRANNHCDGTSISRDGSRVAWVSNATTLVPPFPAAYRAFLRDRVAGTTSLLARLPNGAPANTEVSEVLLSDNGEYAMVCSTSSDLTPGHSGTARDVFVTHIATGWAARATRPLVEPGEPNQSGILWPGAVSDDGLRVTFGASSTNLMAGEPNDFIVDTYMAVVAVTWYRDLDGDGYGTAFATQQGGFVPPAGWSLLATDCDDANAQVHPGATEICNGIDDDCDSSTPDGASPTGYCAAGTSVLGCIPSLSANGFPGASSPSGFVLSANQLPGARQAVLVYGLGPASAIFAFGSTSTICVAPPRSRTVNLPTGGSAGQCNGSYSLDWLAFMAANPSALGQPIHAGQTIYTQVWYRDSGAVLNSNLTAAVAFTLCP